MRSEDCQYFNDIKGCDVVAIYECGDFIEISYIKEGVQKSLVIEYHVYGGSMGFGSFFRFSGVELPQFVIRSERTCTKFFSETLVGMESIIEINSYQHNAHGYGDSEELEIVYQTKEGKKGTYLLYFEMAEDDWLQNRCSHNKKAHFKKQPCNENQMPTELFSMDTYKEVLAFALKAHSEQKTPNELPYSFHIVSVATEIIHSLSEHHISYEEANVSISCALLHDVLEDTDTTMGTNSLDIPNIKIVLQGVWALTKDTKLPSKQKQMQESLERLKQQPKCVQMVKLADRITNLAPAPIFWNKSKRRAYVDEAKIIHTALKDSNPYLADKLQHKIDNYDVEGAHRALSGELISDNYLVFHGESGTTKVQMILDKSHPNYLKTFKALNRLNDYVKKVYDLKLFHSDFTDERYRNFQNKEGFDSYKKVGLEYIANILNSKDLLDLNTHINETISKYMSIIVENENCIV
jgi:hypothetical protein